MVRRMIDKKTIIKKLKALSFRQRAVLFFIFLLSIAGLYGFFVLTSTMTQVATTNYEIGQLEKSILLFQGRIANLPKLQQDLAARNQEMKYAEALLLEDSKALEMLLSSLEQLGKDEGVDFDFFQPGAETTHGFYAEQIIQLKIGGTFHHVLAYLDRLTRINRLLGIQNITLSPVSDFSPTQKYLSVNLVLHIYRALNDAESEKGQVDTP